MSEGGFPSVVARGHYGWVCMATRGPKKLRRWTSLSVAFALSALSDLPVVSAPAASVSSLSYALSILSVVSATAEPSKYIHTSE